MAGKWNILYILFPMTNISFWRYINTRGPNGSLIVYLNIISKSAICFFTVHLYKIETQRTTHRAHEYNVPPFWRIGQGSHLVFPIGPKNTSLVEDVEIFLPVKFHRIPFSCFRGEVENVSANQKPGRPSCFSDRPEKHKLGRVRWDLSSCHDSLNSVYRFQERSRKCLSQSEARAAILFFPSAR